MAKIDVKYIGKNIAIIADLRSSYTHLGRHPEWRLQFVRAISCYKVHQLLDEKLAQFAPFVIYYSKIKPDRNQLIKLSSFTDPTICVMSSVGEHAITPWMIIHNIGHTYLSWHIEIKKGIIKVLGLDPQHYSIVANQAKLVHSAAARRKLIPNMNELIYELFTTWVWYGTTKSDYPELAVYCDDQFAKIMMMHKMIWHKFRSPTEESAAPVDWLKKIIEPVMH